MRPLRCDLELGPDVVRGLLPHREPLLLVDRIRGFRVDPPALVAHKHVRPDEPVFAGHIPGRPLWPGVYTVEALAQATLLLFRLLEVGVENAASPSPLVHEGFLTSIDVKLSRPVLPDSLLELHVALGGGFGGGHQVDVEAIVDRRTVASGRITVAVRPTG